MKFSCKFPTRATQIKLQISLPFLMNKLLGLVSGVSSTRAASITLAAELTEEMPLPGMNAALKLVPESTRKVP